MLAAEGAEGIAFSHPPERAGRVAMPCARSHVSAVGAAISRPRITGLLSDGRLIAAPTVNQGSASKRADRVVQPYSGSSFMAVAALFRLRSRHHTY